MQTDSFLVVAGALLVLIVGVATAVNDTHTTVMQGEPPQPRRRLTAYGFRGRCKRSRRYACPLRYSVKL
jgi:hypothetical protein